MTVAAEPRNEADEQPRGRLIGATKVGSTWLLAGYHGR